MTLAETFQVNLRAALGRRTLRHEPLGVDLDGRIYYVLSHRPIDDDTRPPAAWASGLLVWGSGVPHKPDAEYDEDELPPGVERWSHFGKSAAVKQLSKWIDWRTKKAVEALRPAKSPAKPKATPNGKIKSKSISSAKPSTSKLVQSTLQSTPSKMSSVTKRNSRVEVVIPISVRRKPLAISISSLSSLSSGNKVVEQSGLRQKSSIHVSPPRLAPRFSPTDSNTSSVLSTPPSSSTEDLLALLHPTGYKQNVEKIEEYGKELSRKVSEVAEWLAVLEWKGMGEVH